MDAVKAVFSKYTMQSVRDVLRQSSRSNTVSISEMDAIRTGCAEAKKLAFIRFPALRDAIRAGCAEAKRQHGVLLADRLGCNPCGMFRNERKVIVFKRSCAEQ